MHELSLAQALADEVERVARQNRLTRVVRVEVDVGVLRQVIPDIMQEAFCQVSDGTMAEGAVLQLHFSPALARCRGCQKHYEPDIDDFRCPGCGRADADVLGGEEFLLKTVEGE